MTPEGFTDIEVDISDEEVERLKAAGMVVVEEDGIMLLTEAGSKWLNDWLDTQEKPEA